MMYTLSYATPINPTGSHPILTAEQVWRGLAMKADDAKLFVRDMSQCDVISRTENSLLREITFAGVTHRETVTLFEPVKVHFQREDGTGWIDNTISESEHGLLLTFTFGLRFPGIESGSSAEREKGDAVRGAYVGAVTATLSRVREMAAAGEL